MELIWQFVEGRIMPKSNRVDWKIIYGFQYYPGKITDLGEEWIGVQLEGVSPQPIPNRWLRVDCEPYGGTIYFKAAEKDQIRPALEVGRNIVAVASHAAHLDQDRGPSWGNEEFIGYCRIDEFKAAWAVSVLPRKVRLCIQYDRLCEENK